MTSRAGRFIAGAKHGIAGLMDGVIAMTSSATRDSHLHKYFAVWTFTEQFGIHHVALTTDVDHRGDSGRRSAVIAVTIVTSRRRQIAFNRDHFPMHAGLVLLDLVRRYLVRRHVFLIGVTRAAGVGDVGRMNRRARIVGGAN